MSGYYRESDSYDESSSYDQYSGGGGGGRRGYEDESYSQSESFSEQQSYGGGGGGYGGGGLPPPPRVPWPWRPRWDERSRQYVFQHEQTGETVWSFEEVQTRVQESGGGGGRGYYEQTDEVTEEESYSSRGGGYAGGNRGYGYGGGSEQVYESEQVTEESSRGRGGGHAGLALGAVGGLAAGALAMYEGEKIHNDYEDDKYRVEQGFDNVVDDVEYAPENAAEWVGDKVGEVDRFGDNVEGAYDTGRFEGQYGDDY